MKKLFLTIAVFVAVAIAIPLSAFSAEKCLFSFEESTQGWEIPDWAYEQDDYVGEELSESSDVAKAGKKSLKLGVNFPGNTWSSAIAEVMEYFDWTPYSAIACDIYLPKDAPNGIKAQIVLTVGDNWKWTEMSRSYKLTPGEWAHISGNLKPGSTDWKRTQVTDEFRADVKKNRHKSIIQ